LQASGTATTAGFSLPDDNRHFFDEKIDCDNFQHDIVMSASLLTRLGRTKKR
jgi:hypothetical protein